MSTLVNTVIKTQYGAVRGSIDHGAYAFKGIPFAAPPFDANRLLPPQPVIPWSGVRDALVFGPKAPQPPYPPQIEALIPPELVASGEDCLTLNIWSPELGLTNLPVMVWIAGGEYEFHATGASPWYDGSRFARDGVVCVTINYRVGVEGFLDLGEGNANRGLLDQIAALTWVRENVAAFGGDPGNVTIFGESAGAMSIATLLAMPRAEGMFQRAIVESGSAQHVTTAATAHRITQYFAEKLGVAPTREAIAAVPVDRALAAQLELMGDLMAHPGPDRWGEVAANRLIWEPVVDGVTLPAPPMDRISAGASKDIDILVGSNADEWRLFLVPGGDIEHITDDAVAGTMAAYGLPIEAALATYRAAHPNASAGDLFAAVQGDWYWRIPSVRLAEAHARNGEAIYMYEFAWRSPQYNGHLGACHALEVPFVFDTLGQETESLLGTNPPQQLANAMHAAWIAFATSGDPGWPKYDLSRRATMRFDTTSAVVDDPLAAERMLWDGVR